MFLLACGDLKRLFENLAFHCFLAEQALQFFDLALKGMIFGCRNDIFLGLSYCQSPLGGKLTLGKQLVRLNAIATSHNAHRGVRLTGLLDDSKLLCRRPAMTALRPGQDFYLWIVTGYNGHITSHTYQVGNPVRIFMGRLHLSPAQVSDKGFNHLCAITINTTLWQ